MQTDKKIKNRPKFFIATTVPETLGFFKGNLNFLSSEFDIYAISSGVENLSAFADNEGISFHYIPMKRPISIWSDIKSLYLFIRLFFKTKPDIVHGNTPKASMLSMIASKISNIPIRIYMCHGLRYQGSYGITKYILKVMERISCKCATEVICVSNGVRNTLIKDKICNLNKAIVVKYGSASGIDLNKFSVKAVESKENTRQSLNIKCNDFVFIFAGRIVKDKGVNELVTVFNRLNKEIKNIKLILLGREENSLDPISESTKQIIHNNENILPLGFQPDIRKYLASADTFVLPSYREGFGMVVIEAGAMGLPSIVTDINGCNEIIEEGENGTIVPPRNADALYEAMKRFITDRETTAKMASKARKMVADRYEQQFVWNALFEEYKRLTEESTKLKK